MNQASKEFFTLGWICALMILAEYLCHFFLEPASKTLFHHHAFPNLILCLPKGILIIITWLYRAKGALYLLIAGLISQYVFHANEMDIWFVSIIIIFSIMPFLVLEMFKLCGIDMYQMPGIALRKQWRSIILITFVCAICNAIFQAQVLANKGVMHDTMMLISNEVLASITGVLACMLLISMATRLILLYQYKNN